MQWWQEFSSEFAPFSSLKATSYVLSCLKKHFLAVERTGSEQKTDNLLQESCCSLQSPARPFPHMLVRAHSAAIMANNGSTPGQHMSPSLSTTQTPVGTIVGTNQTTEMAVADDGFFTAIIAAVIAVVVLVFICLFVVILRYMYRYKGTYHTNEAKGTEFAETADAALRSDPVLQDVMDESKKEYFI